MKQIVFIILISMAFVTVKSQTISDNRLSFATTIGMGFPVGKLSSNPVAWQVTGYYNLTDRWSVGIGTGLSFYEKTLIPVYGDIRFQIGRERKFTPYAGFATGYSFAPSDNAHGGYFLNPSIGIWFPLKNKLKLQLATGYELQYLERLKSQTDPYFRKEFSEKQSHHSLFIRLGLNF